MGTLRCQLAQRCKTRGPGRQSSEGFSFRNAIRHLCRGAAALKCVLMTYSVSEIKTGRAVATSRQRLTDVLPARRQAGT